MELIEPTLCIKEVDVYSVLAWIISITDMK